MAASNFLTAGLLFAAAVAVAGFEVVVVVVVAVVAAVGLVDAGTAVEVDES